MINPCGIVLIDKPRGISSAGCVGQIRRMLRGAKVGHGGTLDPDATGLLVLFVGKATTLCDLVMDGEKGYEGEILAGTVTTTDDISGEVIRDDTGNALRILGETDLEKVSEQFRGELFQSPPKVSAVKIDGKRAYLRARKGETFETKPKLVRISELSLTRLDSDSLNSDSLNSDSLNSDSLNSDSLNSDSLNSNRPDLHNSDGNRLSLPAPIPITAPEERAGCILKYRIRCSKGTYVRSLARDLGEYLKCGATVVSIRRNLAMPFSIDDANRLEDLTDPESIRMLPWDYPFRNSPQLAISNEDLTRALHGQQTTLRQLEERFLQVVGDEHRDAILVSEGIRNSKFGVFCLRAGKVHRHFFLPDHSG
jgi:tRNA pseudouridine55 synthase